MTMEERKEYSRQWKRNNKEKCRVMRNAWRLKNKEKWKECCDRYVSNNADKIRKYNNSRSSIRSQYVKEKRKNDIQFRLSGNLRSRMGECIKKQYKSGSAVKDLGCSVDNFKSFIESKWVVGMSWDNYGKNGWHLDHIIPLSLFDLTAREQFLKACHYTNYQPLWALDNIRKSNKRNV